MDYETLKFDIDQGLGIITLNRPEAANAINIPTVSYTHLTLPTT